MRYKFYRFNSGRDQYLNKVWGKEKDMQTARTATTGTGSSFVKPPKEELKKKLTALQYKVTQEEGHRGAVQERVLG